MTQPRFAREFEAIYNILVLQANTGEVYLYPNDVRENMRLIGMRVDQNLPGGPIAFDFDEQYEPDFNDVPVNGDEPPGADETLFDEPLEADA